MYRTLPTTLSLELRMQRYDNFLNPPNFRRSFFSSASLVRLTPIIYRCASVTLTNKTCSPLRRLRHFRNPVLLSCECKGTSTFPIHQMFGQLFSSKCQTALSERTDPHMGIGRVGAIGADQNNRGCRRKRPLAVGRIIAPS